MVNRQELRFLYKYIYIFFLLRLTAKQVKKFSLHLLNSKNIKFILHIFVLFNVSAYFNAYFVTTKLFHTNCL